MFFIPYSTTPFAAIGNIVKADKHVHIFKICMMKLFTLNWKETAVVGIKIYAK